MRHGTATAFLGNLHRISSVRPEPYTAEDFIRWGDLSQHEEVDEAPTLLEDPVAQSNLLRAGLFGLPPK